MDRSTRRTRATSPSATPPARPRNCAASTSAPRTSRRGLARHLVAELLAFAAADGGYRAVYLHTDPAVPGAEAFWRSLGKVVHDERDDPDGGNGGIVHFELGMER